MLSRLLLPAIAWLGLMILIIFRTYESSGCVENKVISQDYLTHFFLFLVCSHIWMGIFKKQLKIDFLRLHTGKLVFFAGAMLALILEIIRYSFNFADSFSFMSLFVDFTGILVGIGIFRLVYRTCC